VIDLKIFRMIDKSPVNWLVNRTFETERRHRRRLCYIEQTHPRQLQQQNSTGCRVELHRQTIQTN
jgi:hypothetical protein